MPPAPAPSRSPLLLRVLGRWGDLWNRTFELIGGVSYLIHDVLVWLLRAVFSRKVRFGRTAMISQIVRIGVRSTGIVMLVCACIGFILALQMDPSLRDWGQQDKIANIVGVAVFRELGPLVAAIVLTGFAGASIACHNGLRVTGGAAGVGKATTDTVVQTVVAVIIADLMFTTVFFQIGWT